MSATHRVLSLLGSILIGLLILTVGIAEPSKRTSPFDVVVESSEPVDVAPLNERVSAALLTAGTWPRSPLRMTLELFGDDVETRSVRIQEEKNRGEGADTTTVTLIRDGFMNDSVRGSWERIVYRRMSDGSWRVIEARRATRCWRGDRLDTYGATPCP